MNGAPAGTESPGGEGGIERDLRPIFDSMFEGIQILDFDWRYVYLNTTAASHGRQAREALLGRRLMDAYPGIEGTEVFARLQRCMTERQPDQLVSDFQHGDGGRSWFSLRISPVPMGVLVLSIDITAEREAEQQLGDAQKLDAMGRLAGGLAHDFNNLLTVIAGYSELVLEDMPAGDPLRTELTEIRRASERGMALTRQLLSFTRRQRWHPEVLDLNDVIGGMHGLLRRLIGEDIDLVTRPAPGPARVRGDRHQLEQVVMNLAVNARDAMPGGGRLSIEVDRVELDEVYASMHAATRAGPHVMLAVSDTGRGMDEQTRARVFEPFFTTKEAGKGTGLGLANVYAIAKQGGGTVWVYSEPGRGAVFKVYLPAAVEPASEPTPPVMRPSGEVSGSEEVLLVEDDVPVRQFIARVLRGAGYAVTDTGDPRAALAAVRREPARYQLLLTDVVMPWMGGRELAESAAVTCPALKVVFMSGYTDEAISHRGGLSPEATFIDKPVAAHDLLRRLREVLARPATHR
jgi:PAS domain S-box-containing protein